MGPERVSSRPPGGCSFLSPTRTPERIPEAHINRHMNRGPLGMGGTTVQDTWGWSDDPTCDVGVPSSYASFLGCHLFMYGPRTRPKPEDAEWKRTWGGGPDRILVRDGLPVGVRATATGFPPADSAHSLQDRTLIRERQKRTDTEIKIAHPRRPPP